MECYRIDEGGYTGFDLLNGDQRLQGASAIAISNEDAAYLIKQHFPKLQAPEIKYRTLARRTNNHERLLALQHDVLSNFKCVTYVCDKRFLLILMFADYAIEPYYYERGIDFYRDGQNYSLASLLYTAGPALLGVEEFEQLLATFQCAVKEKTASALQALLAAARKTNWHALPEALGPLALYSAPECLDAICVPGVSTDAAMVVLQSLITRLEVMSDGPYRIEHDQSKNLMTYHGLIRQFIEHDDEAEFRETQITSLKFPLKLMDVTQVESKTNPAVQMADILVGAAIDAGYSMTGIKSSGMDPIAIMQNYRDDQFISLVPSTDFEAQKEFRKGSQASELIDYLTKTVFSK